jgi:hypothetical protein
MFSPSFLYTLLIFSLLGVEGKWKMVLPIGIRGGNRYNGIKRPLDVIPALRRDWESANHKYWLSFF